jgi:hypothetical protein
MEKIFLVLILILTYSQNAFSWEKTGHRIVGEIAQRNLNSNSLSSIHQLAGSDDLSRLSTWADEIRSDPKMGLTSPWHFVSFPIGKTYFDQKRNKDGDITEALFRFETTLRDPKESKEHRLDALKFIVHLMGDLHQPLNVEHTEVRDGRTICVKWLKETKLCKDSKIVIEAKGFQETKLCKDSKIVIEAKGFQETNLHFFWDECLIDFVELSYTEYANYLNHSTKNEKKEFEKGSYLDWAKESQDLLPKVYDADFSKNLDIDYINKVKPIFELRLKQAGFRLAYVLNKIFNKEKLTKPEIDLMTRVNLNK